MEMCDMHRVYPSLAAIIPANTGGFGDIAKTLEVYKDVEVTPLQQRFLMINDIIGREAVIFE
jgi:capsid portal protein